MIHHYDKGWLVGIEKGREDGIHRGVQTESNRILTILKVIKRGCKTLEQIALEFNESIDFIQKLMD